MFCDVKKRGRGVLLVLEHFWGGFCSQEEWGRINVMTWVYLWRGYVLWSTIFWLLLFSVEGVPISTTNYFNWYIAVILNEKFGFLKQKKTKQHNCWFWKYFCRSCVIFLKARWEIPEVSNLSISMFSFTTSVNVHWALLPLFHYPTSNLSAGSSLSPPGKSPVLQTFAFTFPCTFRRGMPGQISSLF